MQLTVKKPMTVKEYAAEQHIAQQTVYKKISRNADKLKNHVFKMNGKTCLDETAQELLKPDSGNVQLVDKVKRLEEEIVRQPKRKSGTRNIRYIVIIADCLSEKQTNTRSVSPIWSRSFLPKKPKPPKRITK